MIQSKEELAEKAVGLFNQGYSCAESLVMALAVDGGGVTDPQRLATAFGGGIARRGMVCGCLTGAAIGIGQQLGRTRADDKESKERIYAIVNRIFDRVQAKYGTLDCRALTNLDFNTEIEKAELDRVHEQTCIPLVRFVTTIAVEELTKESEGGK